MSDVVLSTGKAGSKRVSYLQVAPSTVISLNLSAVASAAAEYSTAADSGNSIALSMDEIHLQVDLGNGYQLAGMSFKLSNQEYIAKSNGEIHTGIVSSTGNGTKVGTVDPQTGDIKITDWPSGLSNSLGLTTVRGGAVPPVVGADSPYNTYAVTFRLSTAPIRPSSFSLQGSMRDGTTFNVSANSDGVINTTRVKGRINYQTGVVTIVFTTPSAPGQTAADISFLKIPGVTTALLDFAKNETLRYNAVAYTYLPLDSNLLGINPIRLPSDGRVPIFRAAGVAVVGHTDTTAPVTVGNGDTIDAGRERLSRVRLIGHDGVVITTGYTFDLEAGVVTFTNVTGYSQPVRLEHRIEDAGLIRDAQIDGTISLTRALTHNFPIGSYVSSAYTAGDLHARVSLIFDQATWDGTTYSDALVGAAATATYNTGNYPVEVKNDGASTERFVIRFTSATAFQVIGEDLGVIAPGTTAADCAPINPATSQPYFTIRKEGWGTGWATGNIVRLNTVGALASLWVIRTVKQGPSTGEDYTFSLLARGDVDNPL